MKIFASCLGMAAGLLFVPVVAGTVLISFPNVAHAEALDGQSLNNKLFRDELNQYIRSQSQTNPNLQNIPGVADFFSDELIEGVESGRFLRPLFMDQIADDVMDTLALSDGDLGEAQYPIIIGESGVGKSDLTKLIALKILTGDYPDSPAFQRLFEEAAILRVSGRRFLPGGTDLNGFLDNIRWVNNDPSFDRKIILVINESQFLNDYDVGVLREQMEKPNPVSIILETDSKSYSNKISGHPSFTSIAKTYVLSQLKPEEVQEVLKKSLSQSLKEKLDFELSDSLIGAVIDSSKDYRPDVSEPRRSLALAKNFAVNWHRNHRGEEQPQAQDLYRYVAKEARLPVIPQDEKHFVKFMDGLREKIRQKVIGQDRIVDGLVNQFIAALTSRTRQHSVALIMGPTGVGKSLAAKTLAKDFYGDDSRTLELDMTQFSGEESLNTLFGASNGYISSDKEKGVICDFFDGPGKGGGVMILNEIEEAHSDVLTRFMEMFDNGTFRCGDGRVRHLGKTLVVMTSNKNTDKIMSYDSIKGMSREELNRRLAAITQEQLKKAFTEKSSYTEREGKTVKTAVMERVDQLYFASPLLLEDAQKVTQLEVDKFLNDQNGAGSKTQVTVDESFAETMTGAFYNEALGARQIRTAVQQSLSKAINEFKRKYGFDEKTLEISAKLHPSKKTESYITVTNPATGDALTIAGPNVPVENKMLDANFRERLQNLEANLNKELFGQKDAIHLFVSAIQTRYLRGGKGDPMVGFLLGPTGTGKSELGKLTARDLFGREDAFGLFEMGKIESKNDLDTILSPAKGIVGSDQPGELESFLIQHPDGGVLLFDEISNAGGNNVALKNAIAKKFYTMFQEGYYKTPSGKTYDLTKYVILLTGNDGEELFQGASSDSMLESAYEEATKNPNTIKELLQKAGFSAAFLGRLSFAALMRPTLSDTKIMIAGKMLNQWKKQLEAHQPIDLKFDKNLAEQIGLLMFSNQSGARSINHFIFTSLGEAVASEAFKMDWERLIESGGRRTIRIRANVTQSTRPFYESRPFKNHAELIVESLNGRKVASSTVVDFTKTANFMPQVHYDIARATAYHEMGHAVASFTEETGKKVVKITIVPEKLPNGLSALGYAQYEKVPSKVEPNRDYLVKMIAGLLAGSEAEQILGLQRTTGRANDVERAGQLARRLVLENHMLPELDVAKAYTDSKGDLVGNLPPRQKKIFDKYIHEVMEDGRALAIQTLKDNWAVVEAGARELLKKGNLTAKEFEQLVKDHGRQLSLGLSCESELGT